MLSDAYANAAHIEGGDLYPERWIAAAAAFRAEATGEYDLPYGGHPRQVFDLFHPARLSRGIVVFLHGGYWMKTDKSVWSHLAGGAVARGWTVAVPSYRLCPEVRIAEITGDIRAAMAVIAARVPGPIRIAGHSAGGHLTARMLDPRHRPRWTERIAAAVPISPLGDLDPLRQTDLNETLHLDAEEANAESPIHQTPPDVPVTVWVGADERPAFVEQAARLGAAWDCPVVRDPGRHHFDAIEGLSDPDSPLLEALLGPGA